MSHLKKSFFNHSEGGWEGQNRSVPYIVSNTKIVCIYCKLPFIHCELQHNYLNILWTTPRLSVYNVDYTAILCIFCELEHNFLYILLTTPQWSVYIVKYTTIVCIHCELHHNCLFILWSVPQLSVYIVNFTTIVCI